MIISLLMKDETMIEKRIEQMKVRLNQRQRDIERHYRIAQLT